MTTDVTMAPTVSGVRRSGTTSRQREGVRVNFIDGREPADSPWGRGNLLVLALLNALGLMGLGVAWYGVSGEATYGDQVGWIWLAVLSLTVSGIGAVYFLTVGAAVVHRAMREAAHAMRAELVAEPEHEATASSLAGEWVTARLMTRVHRHDCPQVRGKTIHAVSGAEIAELGLKACGVCAP
jgi:hypothetical protein